MYTFLLLLEATAPVHQPAAEGNSNLAVLLPALVLAGISVLYMLRDYLKVLKEKQEAKRNEETPEQAETRRQAEEAHKHAKEKKRKQDLVDAVDLAVSKTAAALTDTLDTQRDAMRRDIRDAVSDSLKDIDKLLREFINSQNLRDGLSARDKEYSDKTNAAFVERIDNLLQLVTSLVKKL